MKVSAHSTVPVYTLSGVGASRELPDWLSNRRKRSLKKDPEFSHRVELLQDFGFNEASSCVRVSEDGQWVMSTGTYKPQMHVHYLPELSLSFSRHTNNLNNTFLLLSSDYSKSVHLQADRSIELHTPLGLHHSTRIPRYGRDMIYARRDAEVLVTATGINDQAMGEVFRLNLELGRFMRSYEVDVGGDDSTSVGYGSLQGSLKVGSVNAAAIAEKSHGLLAFGTSLGTVEFWDPRCRGHVAALAPSFDVNALNERAEVTALQFHNDGLNFAVGSSSGVTHIYDIRSAVPLVKKDQGFGFPIKNIVFLSSDTAQAGQDADPKVLTADKSSIKIWDQQTGTPWTSIQPSVDLNHVEWCPNSGMLLTANEGPQQHAFFIPKLGPAPKWCSFLDNIVEEMAEDANDPNAFKGQLKTGQVFDNFKFVTLPQLQELHLDHLIGTTKLLRPYMHGFFISPKLYEEARMISNPNLVEAERTKTVQERINKERESRIRGKKRLNVKVNRRLVERMLEREEKNAARKARRVLARGGDDDFLDTQAIAAANGDDAMDVDESDESDADQQAQAGGRKLFSDPRFAQLFKEADFEVDEESKEFQLHNAGASASVAAPSADRIASLPKGLTAVDKEAAELERDAQARASHGGAFVSSDEDGDSSSSDEEDEQIHSRRTVHSGRSKSNKTKDGSSRGVRMQASTSSSGFETKSSSVGLESRKKGPSAADLSFETRAAKIKPSSTGLDGRRSARSAGREVFGERELVFVPQGSAKSKGRSGKKAEDGSEEQEEQPAQVRRRKDRRSASGNVMRRLG